jgi:hypothetical protein
MADLTPVEVALGESLSEVTRHERRALLGVSIIGITIARTGLVPSKISALGVEFSQGDQKAVLGILGVVVGYFLIAFAIYSVADFIAWMSRRRDALQQSLDAKRQRLREQAAREYERIRNMQSKDPEIPDSAVVTFLTLPVSIIRALLDFLLPMVVGIYAITTLWTAPAPLQQKPQTSAPTSVNSPGPSVTPKNEGR